MGSINPELKASPLNEANQIQFYVNGKLQTVGNEYSIKTSLVNYIRDVLGLTGTKSFCNEGGCGCCVVHGRKFDKLANKYVDVSVNSCIFPLYNCNGWEFTTVEGIGSKKDGYHPIQKRLADANGSQCGYCSPGFVMNMYNVLKNNPKANKKEIQQSLDGNICRCTGYRAIVESMQSFADNPIGDIEDLSGQLTECCKNKQSQQQSEIAKTTHIRSEVDWYQPNSLDDLKTIYELIIAKDSSSRSKIKFLSANTSAGIYKTTTPNEQQAKTLINLQNVSELNRIDVISDGEKLVVGASVTIKQLIDQFSSSSFKSSNPHLMQAADHLAKLGSGHIRNVATWAGNLWLKKEHPEFPSDVLIALEAVDSRLVILNLADYIQYEVSLDDFLKSKSLNDDKCSSIIHSMIVPLKTEQPSSSFVRTYKTMLRSLNCHAYVNAAVRVHFDDVKSGLVSSSIRPSIVFNGLNDSDSAFYHALNTETFLMGKSLCDEHCVREALNVLRNELLEKEASKVYKLNLALAYFYKYILAFNLECSAESKKINATLKSAIESLNEAGKQKTAESKFQTDESIYPVTEPLPKLNSYSQTAGETKYVNDVSKSNGQLYGAFILSQVANATIDKIYIELASRSRGVAKILLAKDIPGKNSFMTSPFEDEPVFADTEIIYAGQPIGVVLADTYEQAVEAARLVNVTYKEIRKPILTIKDAIAKDSYLTKSQPDKPEIVVGDASAAITNAPHKLTGEIEIDASQFHFYLEGMAAQCEPTDDGYKLECTTQWMDSVHRAVTAVLGLKNASAIDIQVKQIGGAFGGKTTRCNFLASVAALGSHILQRPVRINMDLNTSMTILGKRPPWYAKYVVGFDENGKLLGIEYDWYSDPGFSSNGSLMPVMAHFFDSAYNCPNYLIRTNLVKTHKPASTEMRSPDIFPCMSLNEHVIEHVANYLGKDILDCRQLNFYKKGDVSVGGLVMNNFHLDEMIQDFIKETKYEELKKEVNDFNKQNKFKKRGIALTPVRYNISHCFSYYSAIVSIYRSDGSISISHGGVEMGQGIHTKVAQVCAHELGVPIDMISVKSTNNLTSPNNIWSGGSATSELCSIAVIGCCNKLKETLEPIRNLMPTPEYTWAELIQKAFDQNCNLTAVHLKAPQGPFSGVKSEYDTYGCALADVLIDVLTGDVELLKTHILYDCGQSLNAKIDVGQAEGGFMMGLGFWLLEKTEYDPNTGQCLNNGTWEYKPPLAINLPNELKIRFLEDKKNPLGLYGSKAIGEPAVLLSNSVYFAVRNAIYAANENSTVNLNISAPLTPEVIQSACKLSTDSFKLY